MILSTTQTQLRGAEADGNPWLPIVEFFSVRTNVANQPTDRHYHLLSRVASTAKISVTHWDCFLILTLSLFLSVTTLICMSESLCLEPWKFGLCITGVIAACVLLVCWGLYLWIKRRRGQSAPQTISYTPAKKEIKFVIQRKQTSQHQGASC